MEVASHSLQRHQFPGSPPPVYDKLVTGDLIIQVSSTSPIGNGSPDIHKVGNGRTVVDNEDGKDDQSFPKLVTINGNHVPHDTDDVAPDRPLVLNLEEGGECIPYLHTSNGIDTATDSNAHHAPNSCLDTEQTPTEYGLSDAESIADNFAGDTPFSNAKRVDEPSAQRLAKRLFNLDGFKKSDVAYHLTRDNHFSRKVNEEYFKYYDFSDLNLLEAMRHFFNQFALVGETQERERVLGHFASRYLQCNSGVLVTIYNSSDACHTLTCAIMLLNTDLHGQNIGRKMMLTEFIENLESMNDGEDFPRDMLKLYYGSIKQQEIAWARDETPSAHNHSKAKANRSMEQDQSAQHHNTVPNSFLDMPSHHNFEEYKRGNLQKKKYTRPDLVPVPTGKRGWKNHHVILKGMAIYLLKSAKGKIEEATTKVILLHHSLAQVVRSYKRRSFVFSLRTADWSVYYFSTSNIEDLDSWINSINLASAKLSAEPLAAGVGSQRKFHRPLLPSSPTKLTLAEQFHNHEQRLSDLRQSLREEEGHRPDRKTASRLTIINYEEKWAYLTFELQRYIIYAQLLAADIDEGVDVESSRFEPTPIGEVDEAEKPANEQPEATDEHTTQTPLLPPPQGHHTNTSVSTNILYYQSRDSDEEEVFV